MSYLAAITSIRLCCSACGSHQMCKTARHASTNGSRPIALFPGHVRYVGLPGVLLLVVCKIPAYFNLEKINSPSTKAGSHPVLG